MVGRVFVEVPIVDIGERGRFYTIVIRSPAEAPPRALVLVLPEGMARPRTSLPDAVRGADNGDLVRFIDARELSAHSDVGDVLQQAVASLHHAEVFCPDWRSYAYVIAYRKDFRVFAAAFGMHAVSCRVSEATLAAALADGGTPEPTIGADWVSFSALDPTRVNKWVRLAHDA